MTTTDPEQFFNTSTKLETIATLNKEMTLKSLQFYMCYDFINTTLSVQSFVCLTVETWTSCQ